MKTEREAMTKMDQYHYFFINVNIQLRVLLGILSFGHIHHG